MSKVFVVQNQHRWDASSGKFVPKFDLTKAREFGELVDLLSPTASPFRSEGVVAEMREKLGWYSPGDYLLLVGNPVLIGIAVALASDQAGGLVRVLQWSGSDQRYIPVGLRLK